MTLDVIDPFGDARVVHRSAQVNGKTYKYLYGVPPNGGQVKATVFLIHGWPDLSIAWRHQIPLLLRLGLRVVCPDLIGFGGTDAPKAPPCSLEVYAWKSVSDDIAELARQIGADRIILGGHDWGGAVVYRCALWHPELVTHLFSVCTPFQHPTKEFVPMNQVLQKAPQLAYQLHLAGPDVEAGVQSEDDIRKFLSGMYGGRTAEGQVMFDPKTGVLLDRLPFIGKSPLLSDKELDYYVREYSRNGLHGTLNWYRTREQNWKDELGLKQQDIGVPVLFIQALRDNVLTPSLSVGMEKYIPKLTRREVNAGHWALWQAADAVNVHLKEWFEGVVFGSNSKL